MKLVQVCLTGQYNPNLTYQDNMLAKYYIKMGLEVTTVATPYAFNDKGQEVMVLCGESFVQGQGKLIRLRIKKPLFINKRMRRYCDLTACLYKEKPDIIFVHGCQFIDIFHIVKYAKKHPCVKIYVDNHADFTNSAKNWISKNVLHGIVWKKCARAIEPYTQKFYGVLPARVDFLEDIYKLPSERCELLIMGADDDKIKYCNETDSRDKIRNNYGISPNDFLIVTGGKIDTYKIQTLNLMKAVKDIKDSNLKLLIFGSISQEIQKDFNLLVDGIKIQYLGWANEIQSYEYFSAADLVCFPGRHSVYWEQVAGMGLPMLVKKWDGTTHIDGGDNVDFCYRSDVDELKSCINKIKDPDRYKVMLAAAADFKYKFLYSGIARKSIDFLEDNNADPLDSET